MTICVRVDVKGFLIFKYFGARPPWKHDGPDRSNTSFNNYYGFHVILSVILKKRYIPRVYLLPGFVKI